MIGTIISDVDDKIDITNPLSIPTSLPLVTTRNEVVYPMTPVSINTSTAEYVEILKKAAETHKPVMVAFGADEMATADYVGRFGVPCKVLKVIAESDTEHTAFLLPGPRALILAVTRKKPHVRVKIEVLTDEMHDTDEETKIIFASVQECFENIVNQFCEQPGELLKPLNNLPNYPMKFYFIGYNSPLDLDKKYQLIAAGTLRERSRLALRMLSEEFEKMSIKSKIQRDTHVEMSRQQREHFLRQQILTIQGELGGSAEDIDEQELKERAKEKKWQQHVSDHFDKELKKLERFNMQSPEYAIQYNYLDMMLNLPWDVYSADNFDLENVEAVLDKDHYGLEKVKERIIEQVAVLKLRNDMKAPIICLYGPPGVGKTSLGRSVAEALGREYCRVSLGGLHDEAEIRGHRRTYIGAMPGRVISAMKNCGTSNPVFVLDEIDKIGHDFKGDPSTALLEVLDPEQNVKFHDNYLDVDYDLSKILFIATANDLSTIARPLLDRMELIEISGYVTEEKEQIALRHLLPRQLREHGFGEEEVRFTPEAVRYLIDRHTRESGVRLLDKSIARVLRKIARLKASGKGFPTEITADKVRELLGAPEVNPEEYENNDIPGVVTGLAWTQAGGEILFVESAISKGQGEVLTLTGNLGDVMKESAVIALKFIKAHAEELGIDADSIEGKDVHIHVPEGAIPKDGPSAGITMLTSLASVFTGRKVRERLAMTGEITLRGKLTPVGGVKEKVLAAKRAGITDILLCSQNKKDIEKINPLYLEGLTFHYFDRMTEALSFALLPKED